MMIAQYRATQRARENCTKLSIMRAGTLKGGAYGDPDSSSYFPQSLTAKYYEYTKVQEPAVTRLITSNGVVFSKMLFRNGDMVFT